MATWNLQKVQATEREVEVSFPYSAPFAISQLSFAFWFCCASRRHLVYSHYVSSRCGGRDRGEGGGDRAGTKLIK